MNILIICNKTLKTEKSSPSVSYFRFFWNVASVEGQGSPYLMFILRFCFTFLFHHSYPMKWNGAQHWNWSRYFTCFYTIITKREENALFVVILPRNIIPEWYGSQMPFVRKIYITNSSNSTLTYYAQLHGYRKNRKSQMFFVFRLLAISNEKSHAGCTASRS